MKVVKKAAAIIFVIILAGLVIPQNIAMPVEGATKNNYNANSFWFYPWGKSVTHKGVDIFSREGTNVLAATSGLVVNVGEIERGGNIVLVLGPKWRLHYYAHLKEIKTSLFSWVTKGDVIATVGTTGNAHGKQPHLHYSIYSVLPYVWRADNSPQGWKKMFFINPITYLQELK